MIRLTRAVVTILCAALPMAALAPATARAQNPSDSVQAALDSLGERLERAERALERLQRQLEEQDQAKVQTRLRNRVELSGLVLVNGFYSNARVNNADVPVYVVSPQDATGLPNAYVGAQVRQSRLGLTLSGPRALGARLGADLQLDFYGGQQPSTGGRTFPLLRVRTAAARLDWPHLGLLVGQETQPISPWNPVSFASIGIPGFTGAGNLWFWVPQVRLTYESYSRPRVGLQAAVLAPMLGSPQGTFLTQPDNAEKSRRPMVQGRLYIGWGDGETETQIGAGVHRSWFATAGDSLLVSEAYTVDARIALGEKVLLQGEGFFNGRALAGLGGGGIGQQFGRDGVPVRSRGGWGQLNVRPTFAWELGAGAGMDDPNENDLPLSGLGRNTVYEAHLHWRPGGGLLLGFEYRRIETTYQDGKLGANHLNGFVGVAF